MKMKRLVAGLLVVVMCFLFVSCRQESPKSIVSPTATATPESTISPLLYRVTDQKGNTVWLFGSIHVGRKDYYPLPKYVLDAFEQADGLAVEADIVAFNKNTELQMQAMSHLVYRDGSTIQDHISPELYADTVSILKDHNTYLSSFDLYYPVLWSSMLDSLLYAECGANVNLGIDRYLLDLAYEEKKDIIEIESAMFQYQLLAGLEDDIQEVVLQSSVNAYNNQEKSTAALEQLMELWASGDEAAFKAHISAEDDTLNAEEKKLAAQYNKILLTDRDKTMVAFVEEALAEGQSLFVCVGAAHVVGEGAIVDILKQKGYTVTCVPEVTTTESVVFETDDITGITFYTHYGAGVGYPVPANYMTEITEWLQSFTVGEEVVGILPPGTGTYVVEITYEDGTVVRQNMDVLQIEGKSYYLESNEAPSWFNTLVQ